MLARTQCSVKLHGSISWGLVHLFSHNPVHVISVGMFHRIVISCCFEISYYLHYQNKSHNSVS